MRVSRKLWPYLAAPVVLSFAACGGGDSGGSATPTSAPNTGPLPSGAPADTLLVIAGPGAAHDVLAAALESGAVDRYLLTGRSMDDDAFDGLDFGDAQVWGTQPVAPAAQAEAFNAAFEAAYGYSPADFSLAAYAYDSAYVIALAAAAAGSTGGAAIRDNVFFVANSPGALAVYGVDGFAEAAELAGVGQDVNYIGASGQLDLAADGGSSKGSVQTWRVVGGQVVPIETRDVDLAAEVGAEVPPGARTADDEPGEPPLLIGIIVTGDDEGEALADAAQLAVDEINEAGGVLGGAVELSVQTIADGGADEAASALSDAGATAIIGPAGAEAAAEALDALAGDEVSLFALSGAPELAAVESGGFLFRPVPSEAVQTATLANLGLEMESRSICVLYEAGAGAEVMAAAFRTAFEFKEGVVRDVEPFGPDANGLGALLERCIGA